MIRTITVLLAALLFTAGAPAQPVRQSTVARDPADGRLMPPERVADQIWVMRQPDRLWAAVIGNVTIIEQSDGVVLIDSGGSISDGRDIVQAVRALTPKPIKAVAITHWHNDHPLGVPAVVEAFPAVRIIGTAATRNFLTTETRVGVGKADAKLDAQRQTRAQADVTELNQLAASASDPFLRAQYSLETRWIAQRAKRLIGNYVVLPTEILTDRLLIDDPIAPVELRFLGTGNTHGDLIAWLPGQKTVVTGDIVVLPTPYGFTVSTRPWLDTLARLAQLPFTTLIPGHGKVQRDRTYLATLVWSMQDIAKHAQAAAAAGQTREQALASFDRSEQQARFGAVDAWTKEWLYGYWLEGMFGTAFNEAKGIPAPGK